MQIIENEPTLPGTTRCPVLQFGDDGRIRLDEAPIQAEHSLDVAVDGRLAYRVVCTAEHLVDLALGRLLTEGVIERAEDVACVRLSDDARQVEVELARRAAETGGAAGESGCGDARDDGPHLVAPTFEEVPTTGTGGATYAAVARKRELVPVTPISWDPDWIRNLAARFSCDTPMHKRTHGAHSCFLALRNEILYCCEDLGRHNAFDKVVGCALRDGVDLAQAILLTSGRVPVDMVSKAIRAGVPMLASAAVPTNLTIEMAWRYRLTLVGIKAGTSAFTVYTHPASIQMG